jgi:hypothetical protein
MSLQDNFAVQIDDASMMAKLHRKNGLELIDQAETHGNETARLSASVAVRHAKTALASFNEALGLLPDLTAACKAKRSGDITLLESGSALNAAHRNFS